MSTVTLVIITHNSTTELSSCLDYLLSDGDPEIDTHIWVVDSGSAPGNFPTDPRAAKTIAAPNYGYGSAANIAVREGLSTDWIVVMNPDTRITAAGLRTLVEIAEAEDVDIIGPSLSESPSHGHFDRIPRPPWRRTRFSQARMTASSTDVAVVHGSVLAIRAQTFEKLAGFDERFFLYFEEVDLCVRARAAGARVAYTSIVTAVHAGEGSSEGVASSWRKAERLRGKARFYCKHYSRTEAWMTVAVELLRDPATAPQVLRQLTHNPRAGLSFPAQGVSANDERSTAEG